jgi:diguanylate cyclase (GGDEF)-like protein/PAS domain S-box-containing protein
VLTNRVASTRSMSIFLLLAVVVMASVIWIGLRLLSSSTAANSVVRDPHGQVIQNVQAWLTKENADAGEASLVDLFQKAVLAEPNLIAIQVKWLGDQGSPVRVNATSMVVPDLSTRNGAATVDHQIDSRFVYDAQGPVGQLDFYYRGRTLSQSGVAGNANSKPVVKIWPLLMVLTISVLLCVAQWGRSLSKIHAAQGIPKRVRNSIDMLSEGLLVMDKREKIILTNRAFQKMTGLNIDQLIGKSVSSLSWDCSEVTRKSDFPWIRARDEAQSKIEQLMRFQMPDGAYRFFSINSSPVDSPDEDLNDVLSTFRDVTDSEHHRAETEHMLAMLKSSRDEVRLKNRELQILATQDPMTGCLNRRAFFEQVEVQWKDVSENDGELACLMLDCDHFKNVNDQYGHQTGDDVLRFVSSILVDVFAEPALVCRYGGEEFCVVIQNHWIGSVVEQANLVRERVKALKLDEFPHLAISVSIGISDMRCGAKGPQELINQADRSLYAAKRAGRDTVVTFSESIEQLDEYSFGEGRYTSEHEEEGISMGAVTALVSALAYRDYETAEHSRRVADLCVQLAEGLLSARDIYLLEVAALLHDIGKIGIADAILLKPDRLSNDEWTSMRQYERIGLEIISCTFHCDELFEIMRTYRADYRNESSGSSLPMGNDIPLTARLLKLADAFDAMITKQRHRPARSESEAIKELQNCAGRQFDPALVEHLTHSLQHGVNKADCQFDSQTKLSANAISMQAEQIADAVDARDVVEIQELAANLASTARRHQSEEIASAAEKIQSEAIQGQLEWIALLKNAESLLNLCRASQIETLAQPKKFLSKDDSSS